MSEDKELRVIVAEVAAAYFGNSHVTPTEIPTVISQIAASLSAVGSEAPAAQEQSEPQRKLSPAQIRKSITPDAIVSFEDSKPYKTLRRHLAVRGLTPDQYRDKWGLPKDYPMVAPSYSETRSRLARVSGLGARTTPAAPTPAAAAEPAAAPAKTRRRAPPRKSTRPAGGA